MCVWGGGKRVFIISNNIEELFGVKRIIKELEYRLYMSRCVILRCVRCVEKKTF